MDRSAFPLVVLTPGRADDTEVDGYLALLDELAAGARDAVVLVDLRLCLAISPLVRRRVAEAFGERGEAWTKRVLAQAFVAATPAQRGAVTAVQWMIEGAPDCPIFEDRADAEAFLKSVLEPPSE
ncbi:MAG TPA: hypothetical protein RMH85_26715 [Polyangiaceae bacterium LLY-WYZ-15_(1-7)]|nr:hypothetical protein [Polyangiaceae bacterium LLY-WYZ-15_(1-7)]HJL12098.1 hypothetical protein [Polyangiaceae bacterium LLY-WYZ-15_(1-7)]HJL38756.1 hypothetical protein [Polyangiaceae bacterium LLY-WYZ-15_(1-7)]